MDGEPRLYHPLHLRPQEGNRTNTQEGSVLMAKPTDTSTTEAPKAKRERVVLTPEQKIAKLQAELEAVRQKAEAKAGKARTEAMEKRAALVARIAKLQVQVDAIDAEFPPVTEGETEAPAADADDSTDQAAA